MTARAGKLKIAAVAATVAALAAGGALAGFLLLGGDGASPITVQSLPTRTICGTGSVDFTIDRSRLVAFSGDFRPRSGDKLLLVEMTATNAGGASTRVDPANLALFGDGGARFDQVKPDASYGAPTQALATGESAGLRAAFSVPLKLSAGRLVYDDGCGHEEWIVP